MKFLFWLGVVGLAVLEVALVYFIMPMPGSQRMRSIDLAYVLYTWRWPLRALFGALALIGVVPVWRSAGKTKWIAVVSLLAVCALAYEFNFQMSADHMFLQPTAFSAVK